MTTTYTKSILHHSLPCDVSAEISEHRAFVLGFIAGESVYSEAQIPLSELENHLRAAEAVVKQVAERTKPLGVEVTQIERMMIRLGFVKQVA